MNSALFNSVLQNGPRPLICAKAMPFRQVLLLSCGSAAALLFASKSGGIAEMTLWHAIGNASLSANKAAKPRSGTETRGLSPLLHF